MRGMRMLLLACSLACLLNRTASAQDEGFTPLMKGNALDQFEIVGLDKGAVTIQDGEIRLKGKNHGYVATKKSYHNYILQFEWMYEKFHAKPSDGNSGLLVHIQGPGKVWPQSIEVQIWYKDFGSFFTLGGGKFKPKKDDRQARDKVLNPPEKWNLQEVVCKDGTITAKVNGVEYASGVAANPDRGQIGWMFEGSPIRFRNLKIKDLSGALSAAQPEKKPAGENLYNETYRPQFHFTARKNWLNDPNGLVYYQGEYHLFFQHNPQGIDWGNMTWGHAVSPDLLHWEQLDNALTPDRLGTIFSGSAVVDWDNTSGLQTGSEKVIVCIYTSAGKPFTQSIAFSNDRGRIWKKYDHNPVLQHIASDNRDPKVIWHEPTKQWIMALYLDGQAYALFASPDLREWTKLSDVPSPGGMECPDLFELPVEDNPKETRWVFWAGNGNYLLGRFDGKTFTKESGPHVSEWGENFYAAQTYSDIPKQDGRRIQIGWMRGGKYPRMPFNQQMSFPCELTLRKLPEGLRLCRNPVREIEKLRAKEHQWRNLSLKPGENPLKEIAAELLDIRAEIELGDATAVVLKLHGEAVRYDAKKKVIQCRGKKADLEPVGGQIRLQVLVDRASLEVFGNTGQRCLSFCIPFDPKQTGLELSAEGGTARVAALEAYELRSTWRKDR